TRPSDRLPRTYGTSQGGNDSRIADDACLAKLEGPLPANDLVRRVTSRLVLCASKHGGAVTQQDLRVSLALRNLESAVGKSPAPGFESGKRRTPHVAQLGQGPLFHTRAR